MKTDQVKKLEPIERFLYWIRERHSIYLKKEAKKPKPWTDDVILQQYFFTNPYRENDKVTKWYRENIRTKTKGANLLFATIAFRWFNYTPTGEAMISPRNLLWPKFNCTALLQRLNAIQASGEKVFTGAFTISPSGSTKPKIERVLCDYIQPVHAILEDLYSSIKGRSMEGAWVTLGRMCPGFKGGGFMAYEVVCDLRYTDILNPTDAKTWANLGPGAIRGLNRLNKVANIEAPKPYDWREQMVALRKTVVKELHDMPPIEMREIEHSLCEYDKYERALFGTGHMKRTYSGVGVKKPGPRKV